MRRKKWFCFLFTTVLQCLLLFCFSGCALASTDATAPIVYVYEQGREQGSESAAGLADAALSNREAVLAGLSDYQNIVAEADALQAELAPALRDAFAAGSRIIILGQSGENRVREYFGLPARLLPEPEQGDKTALQEKYPHSQVVRTSDCRLLGQLIYQDARGVSVTNLWVEDLEDEQLLTRAIERGFSHDFLAASSGLAAGAAKSADIIWVVPDAASDSYTFTRCYIDESVTLYCAAYNPMDSGEYMFSVKYRADIEMRGGYYLRDAEIEVRGGSGARNLDYGPEDTDCGPSTSISVGIPSGIGASFTPGARLAIEKVGGGLNRRNLVLNYQPRTLAGTHGWESDGMRCEAHIEAYQPGDSVIGSGSFEFITHDGRDLPGDSLDEIVYFSDGWLSAFKYY